MWAPPPSLLACSLHSCQPGRRQLEVSGTCPQARGHLPVSLWLSMGGGGHTCLTHPLPAGQGRAGQGRQVPSQLGLLPAPSPWAPDRRRLVRTRAGLGPRGRWMAALAGGQRVQWHCTKPHLLPRGGGGLCFTPSTCPGFCKGQRPWNADLGPLQLWTLVPGLAWAACGDHHTHKDVCPGGAPLPDSTSAHLWASSLRESSFCPSPTSHPHPAHTALVSSKLLS